MATRSGISRIDEGQIKETPEGFLDVNLYITRPGVFPYYDQALDKVVMELRPESEVYKKSYLDSFIGKPFTNDHPNEDVNNDNFKKYIEGALYGNHDIAPDGLHTNCRTMVYSKMTINDIKNGKREVSAGYFCDIEEVPGVDPKWGKYDRKQVNLRDGNHVSLVDRARVGKGARVRFDAYEVPENFSNDSETKPNKVTKKKESSMITIKIDGHDVEVSEAAKAAYDAEKIKKDNEIQALKTKTDSTESELTQVKSEKESLQAKYDKASNDLTATQTRLDKFEADILATQAQSIVKGLKTDGLNSRQIKEKVITNQFSWAKLDGAEDSYIETLYEAAVKESAKTVKNPVLDALDSEQNKNLKLDGFEDVDPMLQD